ncbi:hypothetical protein PRIPAC_70732 [Pristionchus pacificus]|uniref:Uncharacterized protein n=1 Tax=Pristionchus pacificus TaxID=54126 RepID=A0A2A6B5F9_PRIPA|nr:hypothetical protein PRIPAC_70732 [Pristionchus pacificus]|eukprot:PDM61093.1 hypothetical protein PRIPAC_54899 [Pristionchus pacificus]
MFLAGMQCVLSLLVLLLPLTEGQQSYLQAALRPPPPIPPSTFSRNPALRSYGKVMGDSLDAGLFRQYVATEGRYQEGSLEKGPDWSIDLHTVAITNFLGQENYPIDITSQLRIFIDLTSRLTRRVDDLTVEVSAFKRSKNWLGCGWVYLPSFALLNSDSICRDNPSCPLAEGRQIFEIPLQPSGVFTRLLKLFHQEKDVYQFEIRLRRVSRPFDDLFCLAIQTRLTV